MSRPIASAAPINRDPGNTHFGSSVHLVLDILLPGYLDADTV